MPVIVFLIIYSEDNPVYFFMKNIIEKYMNEMKQKYSILYFFTQFNNTIENEVEQQGNMIYVKTGTESLSPGILIKTHKSMQYINNTIQYDIIIRTNISSFWNIPKLFSMNLHTEKLSTGIFIDNFFISGTGIILSKDVCIKLCEQLTGIDYNVPYEDVFIMTKLDNIIVSERMPENYWHLLIYGENNVFPENVDDFLYFRVKSENRDYDKIAFTKLLHDVYHLS
jgi:hypothetical protein